MDCIQLVNMIVAMLIAIYFLYSFYKRQMNFLEFFVKNSSEFDTIKSCDEINVKSKYMTEIMFLISVEALLLTMGYVFLFVIQTNFTGADILSSGIHVPIFLLLLGMTIRALYNYHTKRKRTLPLDFKDIEKITLQISLIIDVTLSFINWELGLLILSIIIGKFVWVDFAFGSGTVYEKLKAVFLYFKSSDDWDVTFFCREFAKTYYIIFGVFTFSYYILKDKVNNVFNLLYLMLCCYASVFFLSNSAIGGVDIGNGATKYALLEEERKRNKP